MLDASQDTARRLRSAFGSFATGVTVVTLRDENAAPTGLTINSFSSLSLDPALLLFSVGRNQPSLMRLEAGEHFNVNVLGRTQEDLAWHFARRRDDKFEDVPWIEGYNGMPLIEGAIARFECRKWQIMDGGDHRIVVGEIEDFSIVDEDPLLFFRGRMGQLCADATEGE